MTERPTNSFLRGLGAESYRSLSPHLSLVDVVLEDFLYDDGFPVEWVYFPTSSLLSMVCGSASGQSVETSMIGNEGASGLMEACGSRLSSTNCIVQVNGKAWRAPATLCAALARSDMGFSDLAWRLAELQLAETRQSAFCHATHAVVPRFSRWLLESRDRCGGRIPLPMTQDFLASMLGVQRTTVSAFAAQLQQRGLISYRRGKLEILEPTALEKTACECRSVMVGHRNRLGLNAIDLRSTESVVLQKLA